MKKMKSISLAITAAALSALILPQAIKAQDHKEKRLTDESREAKSEFIKGDPSMENLFKHAYGYAIFPNIGKGAVGVGGAAGGGTVFEGAKAIGTAQMIQVNVGAQVGGKAYREVVFFENKGALERFKNNRTEFDGQASAVAVKSGAGANANYREGVVVFSQEKSGLMLEASIGGQKFTFKSL
jgi:lipid-binding SYLF domain-containing protein